jgi:hypothetical protein
MINVVRRTVMVCVACILLFSSLPGFSSADTANVKVTIDSGTAAIDFTYGTINLARGNEGKLTGIRHLAQNNLWNDTAASTVSAKRGHVTYEHTWGSGTSLAELETTVARKYDGTLTVSQHAQTEQPGISGVQWGFIIPDTYDLIIPALGGIRLTAESPDAAYGFSQFTYPDVWEAQMFLVQGAEGGLLVHADDNAGFFKTLHVKHENGSFYVGIETQAPAPFQQTTKAVSTDWRLKAYAGDWAKGSAMYREWADGAFGLAESSAKAPDWAKDIGFTVLTDLEDQPMLEELAQRVDAERTLLVVPGWRADPYDVNFPNYEPKPDIAARIDAAQALGFRVMLYVNIFGTSFNNENYTQVQPYQVKDPFTLERKRWEYTAGSEQISFAVINPAAEAWRELFVNKMTALVNEVGPDALHLDQSLLMYNDANGLIDGNNMMQGNIALHRELREALPDIALGGESLNEITTRYESFAQRHAYGIFSASGTWDDSKINQVVPASSAIFAPYTTIYGHPDHANPITEDYFMAWHKVVQNRLGAIPMLTRPNLGQIANPTPLMEQLLDEAGWYQSAQPTADFSNMSDPTLFAFRTANGGSAKYVRDSYGEKLTAYDGNPSGGGTDIMRYLYGAETYPLPGSIPGWLLYDEQKLFGLDPDKTYLYLNKVRDPDGFHVYEWPEDVALKRLSSRSTHTTIVMDDKLQSGDIDLLNYEGPVRAGEVLGDGTVHTTAAPFPTTGGFSYSFPGGGTVQHWGDRILAHPPYAGQWQGGHTWLEFDISLPAAAAASFQAGVQLGSEQNVASSDGVTFKVSAWAKAEAPGDRTVLSEEQFSRSASPTAMELDLSELAGKEVTLRLETHPGVTVDNDSAVWVAPTVAVATYGGNRSVSFKVNSPLPLTVVQSSYGAASSVSLGNNHYEITAPASGTVYLIHNVSAPVQLPLSLPGAPYHSSLVFEDGSEGQAQSPFGGFPGSGSVLGLEKQGLDAHPPQHGQTHIEYALNLPADTQAVLQGFAGIKDGSDDSQGAGFRIAVNGTVKWSQDIMPGGAWTPFSIPLAEYAGTSVIITLITDSLGDYGYDRAFWGQPALIVQ